MPTGIVTVEALGTANEDGTGSPMFRFTRTGSLAEAALGGFLVTGTATATADYHEGIGYLSFPIGSDTCDVAVTILDDSLYEGPDPETMTATDIVLWGGGVAYTVGTPGTAELEIVDDDPAPVVTVAWFADAVEGSTSGTFRLTRTGDTSASLTVGYTVATTGSGLATPGDDYYALSGTETFPSGWDTINVSVSAYSDALDEVAEWVWVKLNESAGYVVGGSGAASLSIEDETPEVSISFLDYELSESNSDEELFHSLEDDTHAGHVVIDVGVSVSNVDPNAPPPSGSVGFTAYHQDGTSTALGTAVLGATGIATIPVAAGILAVLGTELEASFTSDAGQSARIVRDGHRTSSQLLRDVDVTDNPTITPASRDLQVIIMGGSTAAEQAHWINSGRRHYGAGAYIITKVHSIVDLGNELAKLPKGSVRELIFNAHGNPNACFLDLNFQFNAAALNEPGAAASKQKILDSFAPGANLQLQSCDAAANAAGIQNMQGLANALRVHVWGPNRPVAGWDDGWRTASDPWVRVNPQP